MSHLSSLETLKGPAGRGSSVYYGKLFIEHFKCHIQYIPEQFDLSMKYA